MTKTWIKTKGTLSAVYNTMIKSDLAWQLEAQKYKTPREFVISAYRSFGLKTLPPWRKLIANLRHLGQLPYAAGSPAGYGDTSSNWDGSDALYTRIEWSAQLAKQYRNYDALALAKQAVGDNMSEHTLLWMQRAESQQQAIALFLMSPEFLRR